MSASYFQVMEHRRARRELPELTRQIANLVRVGERLDNSLEIAAQLAATRRLREVLLQLKAEVRSGERLSSALRKHADLFSEYYASVVAIGETKGDVGAALQRISEHLVRQQRFKDALKTALSYPLVVLAVTGVSLVLMLVYVLPQFKDLFEGTGTALPWFTDMLFRLAGFVRNYGPAILLLLVVLIVLMRIQLRRPGMNDRWHRLLLRLPLVSELIRRSEMIRFSDSLEAALAGGATLLEGLRLSQASVVNRHLRRSLNRVIEAVREGGGLGEGLQAAGDFPLLAARMIQAGEASGSLKESLRHVADVYDREFDTALKRGLNVLEPLLIVSIGVVIAVIVLAMVSAIQELNNIPF